MPSKSRRGRGKKKKGKRGSSPIVAQRQAVAQTYKPVSQAPIPSAKVLTPRSTLPPAQYPYITTELRRIAILAGIMLVVLVVIYLVIS